MRLAELIGLLDVFIWLLPLYKQYQGKYFYFFLTLFLTSASAAVGYRIFQVNPLLTYSVFSIILLSIIFYLQIKRKAVFIIAGVLEILLLLSSANYSYYLSIIIITHSMILLLFLYSFSSNMMIKKQFVLFLFMLVFYEATIIGKLFFMLLHYKMGVALYSIMTAIQFLFCLYFTFYNEKNSFVLLLEPNTLSDEKT